MSSHRAVFCLVAGLILLSLLRSVPGNVLRAKDESDKIAAPQDSAERDQHVRLLSSLSVLIGEWRGVGQPTRGSRAGAWAETSQAAWDFTGDLPAIVWTVDDSPQFRSARFQADKTDQQLQLILTRSDGTVTLLTTPIPSAETAENRPAATKDSSKSPEPSQQRDPQQDSTSPEVLVFVSDPDADTGMRCTFRRISDIRVTLLLEQRTTLSGSFRRVSEIGNTRAGERLAASNSGERQCIVTGGLGTIPVMWQGRTWYVCCEGCRQAFEADPQGTIDAYQARIAAERD